MPPRSRSFHCRELPLSTSMHPPTATATSVRENVAANQRRRRTRRHRLIGRQLWDVQKELLATLFQVLGAPPKDAAQYAERIVGWRAPQPEDNLESENSLYRAAGALYMPRGAPFQTVQELWLVLGLPPALVERMMQFVTVFSGRGEIKTFAAAP